MKRNPPWADKILSTHWAALEARVGAAWMPVRATEDPRLAKLKSDLDYADARIAKGEQIAWREDVAIRYRTVAKRKPKGFKEYGCGRYGCVMPTGTPGIVIKVTTDKTEAAFVAAYLSMPKNKRPVVVPYHRLIAIRSESYSRRPVFVLWRDEAQYVGDVHGWIRNEVRDFEKQYYLDSFDKAFPLMMTCLGAGRSIRKLIGRGAPLKTLHDAVAMMGDAWEAGARTHLPTHLFKNKTKHLAWLLTVFRACATGVTDEPMGSHIGQALLESFDAGLLLADVHINNIGMPTGALLERIGMAPIITDPGHAIALDDRYNGVQVEEI
jgi:hypothetical protein